jgi:transcription elongation factor GreA
MTTKTQPIYLTQEGLDRLKKELRFLQTTERRRIITEIADARAHGDLSENAEYHAAKEAQGHLEDRISKLKGTMQDARLVDESKIDTSKAYILSKVKVLNKKVNKEFEYTLVSPQEADFPKGRISIKSPIGAALLGKAVGDIVEVNVPAGTISLKILTIER